MKSSSRARAIAPVMLLFFAGEAEAGGPEVVVTSDVTGDGIPELVLAGMPTQWLREDRFWLVDGATGEPMERLDLGLQSLLGRPSLLGGFDADGDGYEDLAVLGLVPSVPAETNRHARRAEIVTYSPFLRTEIERWTVPWDGDLLRQPGLSGVSTCTSDAKTTVRAFSANGWHWLAFRSGEPASEESPLGLGEVQSCRLGWKGTSYRSSSTGMVEVQVRGQTRLWSLTVARGLDHCSLVAYEGASCDPVHSVEFAPREEIDHVRIFRVADWDKDGVRDLAVSIFSVSNDNNELQDAAITIHSAGRSGEVLADVPMQNTLGHLYWWPLDGGYHVAADGDLDGDGVLDIVAITHEFGVMRSIESDGVQYDTPSGMTAYSGCTGEVLWVLSEEELY